ncbi:hypothetical protein HK405_002721, partial [Cladochytrium tenue]
VSISDFGDVNISKVAINWCAGKDPNAAAKTKDRGLKPAGKGRKRANEDDGDDDMSVPSFFLWLEGAEVVSEASAFMM